jgi:hypothetical protein
LLACGSGGKKQNKIKKQKIIKQKKYLIDEKKI